MRFSGEIYYPILAYWLNMASELIINSVHFFLAASSHYPNQCLYTYHQIDPKEYTQCLWSQNDLGIRHKDVWKRCLGHYTLFLGQWVNGGYQNSSEKDKNRIVFHREVCPWCGNCVMDVITALLESWATNVMGFSLNDSPAAVTSHCQWHATDGKWVNTLRPR